MVKIITQSSMENVNNHDPKTDPSRRKNFLLKNSSLGTWWGTLDSLIANKGADGWMEPKDCPCFWNRCSQWPEG